MNFGESGFVSTQSVIQLMQELQSGNIPHLVIYYDGVNDTMLHINQVDPPIRTSIKLLTSSRMARVRHHHLLPG
jgi:hypothetical protein